ncbi:recQ [Mytilus coruscus]|uniref:DNA 3'-5' helicase n=1 Tax=Mytilus coruscus TaxID=42192 RepID=A0A6J8EYK2_MYTCO|nr:recQ [Mytilus coruscus]
MFTPTQNIYCKNSAVMIITGKYIVTHSTKNYITAAVKITTKLMVTIKPFVEELKEKKDSFTKTVIYCNLKWCGAGYEECQRHLTIDDMKQLVAQYHASYERLCGSFYERIWENQTLFATEAYSTGTDIPNIRRIIHFGVPKSVESYMQEVGRAGRDGTYAEAIMFYNNNDVAKNVVGLDLKMADFCRTDECRWNFLCHHFGCPQERSLRDHMCCDNCVHKCSCPECSNDRLMVSLDSEMSLEVSAITMMCIKQSLLQYFEAENRILTLPNPVLHTGLSIELAETVAKCVQQRRDLQNELAYLNPNYIGNIIAIVQAYST